MQATARTPEQETRFMEWGIRPIAEQGQRSSDSDPLMKAFLLFRPPTPVQNFINGTDNEDKINVA